MINWVDLVMVAVLGLGINSGRKSDFFTELVILVGYVFAAFFALHYYTLLGNVLNDNFVLPDASQEVLAFSLIAGCIIGLTLLSKGGWLVILKIKLKHEINVWGSIFFAGLKSLLLCSLILFALTISGQGAVSHPAKKSLSFGLLRKPALWSYNVIYSGLVYPFFKEEYRNQKAFRAMQDASNK